MRKFFASTVFIPLVSGCVQLPAGCVGCQVESKVAYAVARPSPCNDFPVSYRVQNAKEQERVLPVDQPTKYIEYGVTQASSSQSCGYGN